MLPFPDKMRRCFARIGWTEARKMRAVIAGHVGVVIRQISTDQLRVDSFKEIVGFPIGRDRKVKVARLHAKRPEPLVYDGVWPQQRIRSQNCAAHGHDLQPANVFSGFPIV